jgi:hypothetical protein
MMFDFGIKSATQNTETGLKLWKIVFRDGWCCAWHPILGVGMVCFEDDV